MTVARYIAESLRVAGTGTLFGVAGSPGGEGAPGGGLWAAAEQAGVRLVRMGQERAAAHAADGYGRASGYPGAVLLPSGPAALAALPALGEALASSSPVVAIASTIQSRLVGKGKGELGETGDLLGAYEAVTKFAARAMHASDVPAILERAIAEASSGRPGPSLVEIPSDVFDAELDAVPGPPSPERQAPAAEVVAEAATLLRLAARPVIWAGGGVLRSGASAELTRLAELLGAPVVTTFMGKGAISESHPLAVGTLLRFPAVQATIARADLLVAVGTRFSALSTSRWRIDLPPQTIHIDADRAVIGRNYPVRLPVVADAKVALGAIADALGPETGPDRSQSPDRARGAGRPDRREEVLKLRKAAFDRAWQEGPREMDLLRAIRDALPSDAVVVHDPTLASAWAAPFFPVSVPGTFHGPYGFGRAGFALPASLGVACVQPDRPVVAFADGRSLAGPAWKLVAAARDARTITVLVFDDSQEGPRREAPPVSVREGRRGRGGIGVSPPPSDSESGSAPDLVRPDLRALAAAYGLPCERVREPEALEAALRAAIDGGGPHLVEVPGAWQPPSASAHL